MERRIEDDLKYCQACGEEYRADAVRCADCGDELISGREMRRIEAEKREKLARRSMTIGPDDELVDVHRGPSVQIKSYQSLLARHHLPALAAGDESGCGKGCCGGELILRVRRQDLREVIAVLEEEYVRSTGLEEYDLSTAGAVFNTMAEQVTCPACGCVFSPTGPTCPDCGLCFR